MRRQSSACRISSMPARRHNEITSAGAIAATRSIASTENVEIARYSASLRRVHVPASRARSASVSCATPDCSHGIGTERRRIKRWCSASSGVPESHHGLDGS
jgi:hypothetical protein